MSAMRQESNFFVQPIAQHSNGELLIADVDMGNATYCVSRFLEAVLSPVDESCW